MNNELSCEHSHYIAVTITGQQTSFTTGHVGLEDESGKREEATATYSVVFCQELLRF